MLTPTELPFHKRVKISENGKGSALISCSLAKVVKSVKLLKVTRRQKRSLIASGQTNRMKRQQEIGRNRLRCDRSAPMSLEKLERLRFQTVLWYATLLRSHEIRGRESVRPATRTLASLCLANPKAISISLTSLAFGAKMATHRRLSKPC